MLNEAFSVILAVTLTGLLAVYFSGWVESFAVLAQVMHV